MEREPKVEANTWKNLLKVGGEVYKSELETELKLNEITSSEGT